MKLLYCRRSVFWRAALAVVIGCPVLVADGAPIPAPAAVVFNRDIRPILAENCYACHGPDQNTRKARLRLDLPADALIEHKGGRPIVPGRPDESTVMHRVESVDPDEVMPPPKTGKTLSPAQVALLRGWIAAGAKYEGHWAYNPPVRPQVPPADGWPRGERGEKGQERPGAGLNPIDAFILARLRREGLEPSPEADRRTLIRRLSLDLTGLPPDARDVAAFVQSRDPRAYDRLVEKYLAADAHAERMALPWLDWVRYADTIGFHGDCDFSVWPYRDYVLRAFRENMPFDRFTREQLAGDLLPGATPEQRVASAYNRLLRISTEGGVQDREYLAKYAADRVRTTAGVWLGATMGCAECHDHKFDPYSMRDFYSMAAFFADLKERGFYADGFDKNDWGPKLKLPTPAQQRRLDELDARIKAVRARIDASSLDAPAAAQETGSGSLLKGGPAGADPGRRAGQPAWESRVLALEKEKLLDWQTQTPRSAVSEGGATLSIGDDKAITAGGPAPDTDTYVVTFQPGPGRWEAVRLETLTDEVFPGNRIARAGTTFVVTQFKMAVSAGGRFRSWPLAHVVADADGDGYPALAMIDGEAESGWAITSGHSRGHLAAFHFAHPLVTTSNTIIRVRIEQQSHQRRATIGRCKLALHALGQATIDGKGLPDPVLKAIQVDPAQRNEEQRKRVADHYRRVAPSLTSLHREVAQLEAERNRLLARIPATLVSEAVSSPRPMRVLPRGNWMDDSGAEVVPAVPGFLGRPGSAPRAAGRLTRLDLADWIVSTNNPLTARVFVNRLWRQFFGAGLTRSPEDLGVQGDWPTHPELLDWLACEFMTPALTSSPPPHPWDVRHLIRLIVTSRAYRQSSVARADLEQRDPDNRLIARQGRFRLDAELVRDNALAIAGLLVEQFGGSSVKPYQPEGYYLPLNFPKREYQAGHGAELYRRGLYTHWQRTFLHPSLLAFDAPSREECTVNRPNSNTPLQALVLLNDPTYVEAARVFAARTMPRAGRSPEAGIRWAFERAVARPPTDGERALLADLWRREVTRFRADPPAAAALASVGESPRPRGLDVAELAAWTSVTRAILNLHETITRY